MRSHEGWSLWNNHSLPFPFNNKGFAGEGEGDGEGDGQGAAGDVQQQLATLQSQLNETTSKLKGLEDAKVDLEQRLEEADKELLSDDFLSFKEGKSKGKSPADSKDGELEIDLDRASNRELVQFVEKKYKGDVDAAVKDIRKELDLSKRQIGMIAAQFDVALASIRHNGSDGKPSFESAKKQIFEIAKANPTWDAEKCYRQYLLENKAVLEKDAEEKRRKAEEEEKAATERAGVPGSSVTEKQLSKDEAAEIAYRKAFGNKE